MVRFRHILATIDTRFDDESVFQEACRLAQVAEARLTLLDVVPEFSWPARWMGVDAQSIRMEIEQQKRSRLEQLAQTAKSSGLDVTWKVLSGKTSQAIIREVESSGVDLVIRAAKGKTSRRLGNVGTTAVQLLRHCPSCVWLVRGSVLPARPVIVGTVDASVHDEPHRKLNLRVLEVTTELARIYGADWHVVYSWMIFGENVLRERLSDEEWQQLVQANKAEHEGLLMRVLEEAGLADQRERAHAVHGDAYVAVPDFLKKQNANLVVIGTVARTGVAAFLIGNTAEQVMERSHCSILAVKLQQT